MTTKFIKDFKSGDKVLSHGAVFEIIADAEESNSHRPQAAHLKTAQGPSDCAFAQGRWLSGEIIPGYFGPNQNWTFQGNLLAGQYQLS